MSGSFWPKAMETIIIDRPPPQPRHSNGYRLNEMEVGGYLEPPYGSAEEARLIRSRFWRAIYDYTRSVPGRGRRFSMRKGRGTLRLVRVA